MGSESDGAPGPVGPRPSCRRRGEPGGGGAAARSAAGEEAARRQRGRARGRGAARPRQWRRRRRGGARGASGLGNGSAVRTERGRDRGRRARERGRPAGGRASLTRAPCRQVNPPARPGPAGSAAGLRGGGPVLEGEAAVPGPAPCGRPGRAGLGGCGAADGGPASPPGRERPPRPPARRPGGGVVPAGVCLSAGPAPSEHPSLGGVCVAAPSPRGAPPGGAGAGAGSCPGSCPWPAGRVWCGAVRCGAVRCGFSGGAGHLSPVRPQPVSLLFWWGAHVPPPAPLPTPAAWRRGPWGVESSSCCRAGRGYRGHGGWGWGGGMVVVVAGDAADVFGAGTSALGCSPAASL